MNVDLNSKVAEWRRKSLDGTLTLDEMKEAIRVMRQGRVSAAIASGKSKEKKTPLVLDSDDLMRELEEGL